MLDLVCVCTCTHNVCVHVHAHCTRVSRTSVHVVRVFVHTCALRCTLTAHAFFISCTFMHTIVHMLLRLKKARKGSGEMYLRACQAFSKRDGSCAVKCTCVAHACTSVHRRAAGDLSVCTFVHTDGFPQAGLSGIAALKPCSYEYTPINL